jgi:hypothetical protein
MNMTASFVRNWHAKQQHTAALAEAALLMQSANQLTCLVLQNSVCIQRKHTQ